MNRAFRGFASLSFTRAWCLNMDRNWRQICQVYAMRPETWKPEWERVRAAAKDAYMGRIYFEDCVQLFCSLILVAKPCTAQQACDAYILVAERCSRVSQVRFKDEYLKAIRLGDLHLGFVLDQLAEALPLTGSSRPDLDEALAPIVEKHFRPGAPITQPDWFKAETGIDLRKAIVVTDGVTGKPIEPRTCPFQVVRDRLIQQGKAKP